MPLSESLSPPCNRLLSLDGGGIRGLFTLEILDRIEHQLRQRYGKPDLVLADYFNFIGGTSTGAIIAAFIARGDSVATVFENYLKMAPTIFRPIKGWSMIRHKFPSIPLANELKRIFSDDGSEALTLGSDALRSYLMLVLRNGSTGSAWPLTNNPKAPYNVRTDVGESNLDLPLWQLIRASAAAPTFFPSEMMKVHRRDGASAEFEFIDGGVSPYCNPALAMFMHATLPEYGMNMAKGLDEMLLVSVGTGTVPVVHAPGKFANINRIGAAVRTLKSIMQGVLDQQDKICRVLGKCLVGPEVDRELGNMVGTPAAAMEPKFFTYLRYDHLFTDDEQEECRRVTKSKSAFSLDGLDSIDLLREIGRRVAERDVALAHYPEAPLHARRMVYG